MAVCATPGCPVLVTKGHCNQHTKQRRHQSDKRRPTARARGYNRQWQQTRAKYFAARPYCQHPGCTSPATELHHLDGQGPNGPRGHDWTNLLGLCHTHHAQRTAREQPGGWHAA